MANPEYKTVSSVPSRHQIAQMLMPDETALAQRSGPIVPLVAETGGMNAMIVDSSALPKQAVGGTGGWRCRGIGL